MLRLAKLVVTIVAFVPFLFLLLTFLLLLLLLLLPLFFSRRVVITVVATDIYFVAKVDSIGIVVNTYAVGAVAVNVNVVPV